MAATVDPQTSVKLSRQYFRTKQVSSYKKLFCFGQLKSILFLNVTNYIIYFIFVVKKHSEEVRVSFNLVHIVFNLFI